MPKRAAFEQAQATTHSCGLQASTLVLAWVGQPKYRVTSCRNEKLQLWHSWYPPQISKSHRFSPACQVEYDSDGRVSLSLLDGLEDNESPAVGSDVVPCCSFRIEERRRRPRLRKLAPLVTSTAISVSPSK